VIDGIKLVSEQRGSDNEKENEEKIKIHKDINDNKLIDYINHNNTSFKKDKSQRKTSTFPKLKYNLILNRNIWHMKQNLDINKKLKIFSKPHNSNKFSLIY